MKYRGMEYAVIQEVDRGTWIWTVDPIDGAAELVCAKREKVH